MQLKKYLKIKTLAIFVTVVWGIMMIISYVYTNNSFHNLKDLERKYSKIEKFHNLNTELDTLQNKILYGDDQEYKQWLQKYQEIDQLLNSFIPLQYRLNFTKLKELKQHYRELKELFYIEYRSTHDLQKVMRIENNSEKIKKIIEEMTGNVDSKHRKLVLETNNQVNLILAIAVVFSFFMLALIWSFIVNPLTRIAEQINKNNGSFQFLDCSPKILYELDVLVNSLQSLILTRKKYENQLLNEKKFLEYLYNSLPDCAITTNGKEMISVNQSTLDFFGFENFEALHEKYECICDFFEAEEGFITRTIDGQEWADYIYKNPGEYLAMVIRSGKKTIFQVEVKHFNTGIQAYYLIVLKDVTNKEVELMETKYQTTHDTLTGIYNRAKFNEIMNFEIEKFQRDQSQKLSAAILDIDFFKKVNDTYGHLVGDEVLVGLSKHVQKHIRSIDCFARWGGEEFVLLMFNTDLEEAKIFLDRVRESVAAYHFDKVGHITISCGVSELKVEDDLESLFERCDQALYEAKESGRNKVCIA